MIGREAACHSPSHERLVLRLDAELEQVTGRLREVRQNGEESLSLCPNLQAKGDLPSH